MKRKILGITLIGLLTILLASWTSVNTGAVTTPFNYTEPFVHTFWVPCTGEWVDFEGNIMIFGNTVLSNDGSVHVDYHETLQGVSGIGQSTGNSYHYTGVYHTQLNLNVGGNYSDVFNTKIVSNGTQFNQTHNNQITVNANGVWTVEFYTEEIDCN